MKYAHRNVQGDTFKLPIIQPAVYNPKIYKNIKQAKAENPYNTEAALKGTYIIKRQVHRFLICILWF